RSGRPRLPAGHLVSRRLEPHARSRDRQHGLLHRPAARRCDPDGFDTARRIRGHDDGRHGDRRLGRGRLRAARRACDVMITRLDWVVLVSYLVLVAAIGLIVGYRVRKSGEYFLGERRFGPWVMISQSFTVGTHAEMPVALAGAVYTTGASAI